MIPPAQPGAPAERLPTVAGGVSKGVRVAALVLAIAGFIAAYGGTLRMLWRVWMHNPNYSHGFLIPPVTLWLLWRQRRAIRAAWNERGSLYGMIVLAPALVLQILGLRGDVTTIQGASLILALGGTIWMLFGGAVMRRAAFPLAFLFFMIPTLPWFINVASFKLKLIAAQSAVAVSQAMGITVQREGVNMIFPGGALSVENACSGLRSLIALLALGALFAYLARGAVWKRVLLFVLALPIAVVANAVRITALCIYASVGSVQGAAGIFHDVGGYALFGVAFLLLVASRRVLRC